MGVFDRFPFTNFHELNLDWIMQEIGRYDEIISSFQAWQVESEEDLRAMQSQVQLISNQMESFQTLRSGRRTTFYMFSIVGDISQW